MVVVVTGFVVVVVTGGFVVVVVGATVVVVTGGNVVVVVVLVGGVPEQLSVLFGSTFDASSNRFRHHSPAELFQS